MALEQVVTTGELERAFCAALIEVDVEDVVTDAEFAPFCPDELIEEPLPPDTVIVEEAVSTPKRRALMALCAFGGLTLGVCFAFFF